MDDAPKIKPIKVKEYECKQSRYKQAPKLPCRSILLGPSGAGKGVLLQNLILDIYKDCFSRIYIWSPSIHVDKTWEPVKKYIESTIGFESDDDQFYYDYYKHSDLEKVINDQMKISTYMKNNNHKKLYSILVIVDDFADSPEFSRHSKLLHSLFTRGRHSFISSMVSTQKASALATIIRVNATEWYVFRLRSYQDLQMVLEELGAIENKQTILDIYNKATSEPYSFLYVNLRATDKNEIFKIRFDQKLQIED
jgi:hypothetical protein